MDAEPTGLGHEQAPPDFDHAEFQELLAPVQGTGDLDWDDQGLAATPGFDLVRALYV